MKLILSLMLLLPAAGAVFHLAAGRFAPRRVIEAAACSVIAGSFIAAVAALYSLGNETVKVTFFTWFSVGDFTAAVDALFDPMAACMAVMVTFTAGLIHLYSIFYMHDDEDYARYFCYMNLFVFSMLVIVLADNLIFLFLGWEGVGFCSYALIGFWHKDIANASAGRKAFLLTRIGDVGFAVALGFFFLWFGNVSISHINAHVDVLTTSGATLLGLLLLWSAMGKSAQLPLVVWLPDAMAGPTPVSALIHAATMVTAGVYLLLRLHPVLALSPTAQLAVSVAGTATAFYAACAALMQRDIKKVLAYSTISQLGYMFLATGAGELSGAMAHLLNHAFFKALLFLGAGCVIHALHEQDIFKMGREVRTRLPETGFLFLMGVLALAAVPPTSGFISKDRILLAVATHSGAAYKFLWATASFTAALTALYAFRLYFLVFTGEPTEPRAHEIKDLPRPMTAVLRPLAFLSIVAGFLNLPEAMGGGEHLTRYLFPHAGAHAVSAALEWNLALADTLLIGASAGLAYFLYGPNGLLRGPVPEHGIQGFLASGFGLDRLYGLCIVRPYRFLARLLWVEADRNTVDHGFIVAARSTVTLASGFRLWTSGKIPTYLLSLFAGFAVIACALAAGLFQP